MSYYRWDLAADLARLDGESFAPELQRIGKLIGYGRAQQILQVLWAKHLAVNGFATVGALLPEPLEAQQPASAQPVAVPDGYALVPIEPTDDMCAAAWESEGTDYVGEHHRIVRFDIAYKAALAAAQTPERVQGGDTTLAHDMALLELIGKIDPELDGSIEDVRAASRKLDTMRAVPDGYVLAPASATPEMIEAAEGVEDLYRRGTPNTWAIVYHAMLSAAKKQGGV